jgi:hypothetical protein
MRDLHWPTKANLPDYLTFGRTPFIVRIDQPEIKAVNRRGPSNGSTIQEPADDSGFFARPNWDRGYGESDVGGRWGWLEIDI